MYPSSLTALPAPCIRFGLAFLKRSIAAAALLVIAGAMIFWGGSGPVPVDWIVTAQLWTVDGEGKAVEEVGHAGRFLKAIDAAHQPYIGLTPPDRRGFYRFDIRFSSHGREIGSYSTYFKLVKPEWRARLELNRRIARPGERILSRVESLGSETLGYGEPVSVQRKEKGSWVDTPGLTPDGWFDSAGFLEPGGIGQCNELDLPTDTAPGRYRIVKDVNRPRGPRKTVIVTLIAPFRVVPSEVAVRAHRHIAAATTICLVVGLLAAVGESRAAPPSGGAGESTAGFCDAHRQARDFGFSRLPPVHELDESTAGEELGHPQVRVEGGIPGLPEVRAVDRPGKFGYRFAESSSPNPVFVHWTVTETMWAVDAHGGHAVEVGHTGVVVNSINVQHEVSIGLSPPHRKGFYRSDLRIIEKGETIGTYSSYMKQVRPSWRARLQVEHRVVLAGGRVRWRLGNLGTEQISFGGEPTVQRMEDGSWSRVHGVAQGLSLLMEYYLWPGGESGCSSLHLPADLIPGRYRLIEGVDLFHWPKDKPNHVTLTAPFTVLAAR